MPSTAFHPPGTDAGQRPLAASFATAFGTLLTVEVLFFGGLLVVPDPRLDRVTVVIAVLAVAGAAASLMVFRGLRGGWILLVLTAVGALAALAVMVLLLGTLGLTTEMWAAVLLAVGPLGCLVLAPQRSVRAWAGTSPHGGTAGT